MQGLIVIIEVFREPVSRQIFDFLVKYRRYWQIILLQNVEEEYELVLSLFPIVNLLLKFDQQLS